MDGRIDTEELMNSLENDFDLSIHEIMDLHAQIRSEVPETGGSEKVAETWWEMGKRAKRTGQNTQLYETAMFMAHLYNKEHVEYIEDLIDAYCVNKKYKEAIDFLLKLYLMAKDQDHSRFWDKLVTLLPIGRLLVHIHANKQNPLEAFVRELKLDEEHYMTWMTLGYTLKFHDFQILANQALDNALALKYFYVE